ncbi:N-methyl-D-aspartate receptor NMDAR2C subunit [Comamonas sp. JNW]|jgi:predicted metal-dependent HD superfamily phosphohydrolase|uniref:HD domain-containing protein n=1 Tax=unclassified Comamonas TaxID=2638500 RepID=UPI000DE7A0D5|nr:N-methyl-D-aspartate receptor NMDAR2C subunit [Comamonas sp. JNW]PWB20865.1 N-methyl-D-aspartate receptor NMDAR2C subunit [Comamonas sp. JNW]
MASSARASDAQIFSAAWERAWQDLGLTPAPNALPQLLAAHAGPDRHYHGLQHIAECLQWLEQLRPQIAQPAELALALCFHDAIYDPQAKDNERRSANWAQAVMQAAGAAPDALQRVDALVMATCHFQPAQAPLPADSAWMLDIDLSILGAPAARFAQYQAQIQAEYAWVPAADYALRRQAVLRSFLQRPAIYQTATMRARLEAQARQNLEQALALAIA